MRIRYGLSILVFIYVSNIDGVAHVGAAFQKYTERVSKLLRKL